MKKLTRGALVILAAGIACSAHGGIITSGSFSLSTVSSHQGIFSAAVSGDNFAATLISTDAMILLSGFPPIQLSLNGTSGITWGGEFGSSGVLYNGVFYSPPPFVQPLPGVPFASNSFNVKLISPALITGPGTYNLNFSVRLDFELFDESHTPFYSETDTG